LLSPRLLQWVTVLNLMFVLVLVLNFTPKTLILQLLMLSTLFVLARTRRNVSLMLKKITGPFISTLLLLPVFRLGLAPKILVFLLLPSLMVLLR